MPAGPPGTGGGLRDSLVDVLLEFLETLVHQVLFVRELYSPELFERRRAYGIATRRARHPELAAYIEDAVKGLRVGAAGGFAGGGQGRPLQRIAACLSVSCCAHRSITLVASHPLTFARCSWPRSGCRAHWPAARSPGWQ